MHRLLIQLIALLGLCGTASPCTQEAQGPPDIDLSDWDARRGNIDAAFDRGLGLDSTDAADLLAEVLEAEDVPAWYELEIRALDNCFERARSLEPAERQRLEAALGTRPDHRADGDGAIAELQKTIETLGEILGPSHPATVQRWWTLSKICTELGRWDDALEFADRSMELAETDRFNGKVRPIQIAFRQMWVGFLLVRMGQHERAERELLASHQVFVERQAREQGAFVEISLYVINYLGMEYQATGRLDDAEAMLKTYVEGTGAAFGETSNPHLGALNNLATLLAAQGKHDQSITLQAEVLARALRVMEPGDPNLTQLWLNLGSACSAAGRMQDAREALSEIAFEPGPLPIQAGMGALARMRLAYLESVSGRYELARDHAEASLEQHRRFPALSQSDERKLNMMLLSVLLALNDHAGIARRLPAVEEVAPPGWSHRMKLMHGVIAEGQGDQAGALAHYRKAQDLSSETSSLEDGWASSAALREAALLYRSGDTAGARTALTRSIQFHEGIRARLDLGFERSAFTRSPARALGHVNLALANAEEAWRDLERAHARSLTELIRSSPSPERRALKRTLNDLEKRLATLGPESAATAGEAAEGQRNLEAERLQVIAQILELTESQTPAPATLAQVQASLAPGTALVGWTQLDWAGTREAYSWTLRSTGDVRFFPIPLSDALDPAKELRALSAELESEAASPFPSDAVSPKHASLGGLLFRALVESGALEGAEHLVLVPSVFEGIPFGALTLGSEWVSERWSLSYSPSCGAYVELQARPAVNSRRALVLGDPPFRPEHLTAVSEGEADAVAPGSQSLALLRSSSSLSDLARIPETLKEARSVASQFDAATLWTGLEANEPALQGLARSGELADYAVIHLASHAVVDSHDPRRSGIALSQLGLPDPYACALRDEPIVDGFLSVPEVLADWNLQANLVTLSACSSALGSPVHGEGYVGLATAFLQAGARSMLVSLWDVQDKPTRLLMESFYSHWRADTGELAKARALQTAQRELRDYEENGKRPYAHPSYWSAFVLIGSPD